MSYAISSLLRLALDTDVQVAAMRSRGGASWQLVNRALARQFTLLLSVPLVLETAVNGRADLLVTFNQKDFAAVAERFALKILRPSEALDRLRALAKE